MMCHVTSQRGKHSIQLFSIDHDCSVSPLSSTNRFRTWPLDRHSIAAYLTLNSIAIASVSLELRAFSRVDVELTVRQVTAQLNKSSPQERQPAFHSPDFVKRIFSSSSIKKKFTIPFCTF